MRVMPAVACLMVLALGCGRTEPNTPRSAQVPDGSVLAPCHLTASAPSVDLGEVPIGTTASGTVVLTNDGEATCDVLLGLNSSTDPEFALQQGPTLQIAGDDSVLVTVTFAATSRDLPRLRTGTLVAVATGNLLGVSLKATITIGCELLASPNPLDFGSVPLNTSKSAQVTVTNDGTSPCNVSQLALAPGTDKLFTIPDAQARAFVVPPAGSATVEVDFSGDDSTEPHQRSGILQLVASQSVGLPLNPPVTTSILLTAFIDTVCRAGSQWIYTIDDQGTLSTFNPLTLTFSDIATLYCGDLDKVGTPFSMAVDQSTIAWVEYEKGNIFRVDPSTGSCSSTSFQVNPELTAFGMGFVYQPLTRQDTLYVAGGKDLTTLPSTSTLGTISFPDLTLTSIASLDLGAPELTGTGDGQLWAMSPATYSKFGQTTLARIDPSTGAILTSLTYPTIGYTPTSWALKFWGGSFWMFLGDSIYEVPRATGVLRVAVEGTGRFIVGAGVSTCAPLD